MIDHYQFRIESIKVHHEGAVHLSSSGVEVILTNTWITLAQYLKVGDLLHLVWSGGLLPIPFDFSPNRHLIVHPSIMISPSMIQQAQKCMYATLYKERFGKWNQVVITVI